MGGLYGRGLSVGKYDTGVIVRNRDHTVPGSLAANGLVLKSGDRPSGMLEVWYLRIPCDDPGGEGSRRLKFGLTLDKMKPHVRMLRRRCLGIRERKGESCGLTEQK